MTIEMPSNQEKVQLPADHDSLGLGNLVAIHRWRKTSHQILGWYIPILIILFATVIYAIWIFQKLQTKNGLLAAIYHLQPWIMIIYLLLLTLICAVIYHYWSARRFVAVYQNGIHWRLKGFRSHKLTWSDIEGIATASIEKSFFGITLDYEVHSILYPKFGSAVEFDDRIQDQQGLVDELKRFYYPAIYPELKASFESGKEINFGPVSIQKNIIHVAKSLPYGEFLRTNDISNLTKPVSSKTIPWSQVDRFSIDSGFLVVKSGNSILKRIPISFIPNFEILLKLVELEVKP